MKVWVFFSWFLWLNLKESCTYRVKMTYQLQIIFPILFFLIKKFNVARQFLTYSSPFKTRHHLLCIHLISAVTNWSTLRLLIPYTTHQEFLTRPLEGPDQRLRGQLAIILPLDTVREDAPKDSHQIRRVKQPGEDSRKMSYLGSGRNLSLIYFSRRLSCLSKASLFSLRVHWTWSRGVGSFPHVPSLGLGYHWGAGLQTECLYAWNRGSNFSSCRLEVTCSLKPDNPHHFRTPLQQLQRSLISLLANNPFEFKSRESRWAFEMSRKKAAKEKERDKKQCYK